MQHKNNNMDNKINYWFTDDFHLDQLTVNEEYEKQYVQCEQLCAYSEQNDMEKWLQPDDPFSNADTFGLEFTHLFYLIGHYLLLDEMARNL